MNPPTFPARPVNGGPLDKAPPKSGEWYYEPKYNGWRALVHVPTGTMFNRQGERLSIEKEFAKALDTLRCLWIDNGSDGRIVDVPEWLDCEALERRHNIGRGTLIVLDMILPLLGERAGVRASVPLTYRQRNNAIHEWVATMEFSDDAMRPCGLNEVRSVPRWENHGDGTPGRAFSQQLWEEMQSANQALGCDFYEGLVAKRADSLYPIQLRSPDVEFPFWVKHRWKFSPTSRTATASRPSK